MRLDLHEMQLLTDQEDTSQLFTYFHSTSLLALHAPRNPGTTKDSFSREPAHVCQYHLHGERCSKAISPPYLCETLNVRVVRNGPGAPVPLPPAWRA